MRSVVQKGGESILAQIVEVKDFLLEKAVVFADMLLKGGYQYVNGLLCGIVNGIIEGLSGTLELFAMIFRATSELHKMTKDIFDTFLVLKEMLENVIEAFLEHQLGKFLKLLANVPFRIIDALAQFNVKEVLQSAGTLISGMTPAKIGYFIGYAGGMVIEMALEALFTAGIATAAKVALKYSKKLAEGVTTAANQGANAIRKVSQANADTFIKQITALFESLRKKEAIPLLQKWIDDLILQIKKALGLVDEVAEGAAKKADDLTRQLNELAELKRIDDAIIKLKIQIKIPKNVLSAAESVKRMDNIYSTLRNMKGSNKFNPKKSKLAIENKNVPLSKNGISSDFENAPYLYKTNGDQRNIVKIKLTGNRALDEKLAYELAGIKKTDFIHENYVWHHMNDFDPVNGTCIMQLVEDAVHTFSKPHYGATSLVDYFYQKAIYSRKLSLKI
jgi:hypothetical protein